jgi:hypothetical protein
MKTDMIDFDKWSDELDITSLNEKGTAILKRRYYIKGENSLTLSKDSPIIAEGITAFLYSNSYSGGLQLPPINFSGNLGGIDTVKYFQQYFEIRKKFYLQKENSKPDSVHKKLFKDFILSHIKQEQKFYKEHKEYFESITDKEERQLREKFVESYLKWIKNKQNPLTIFEYLEIGFWILLFVIISCLIVFEFCFVEKEWNFVQIFINKRFLKSDELQKQIVVYLFVALIGSVGVGFMRIMKIFKAHIIKQ